MSASPQILVIETSTAHGSIAIMTGTGTWHQSGWVSERDHNQWIFGILDRLIEESGVKADRFDLVLTGTGPGSYSGTRVGIAVALGVGIASKCPVAGIPSASAVDSAADGGRVLLVGDARRGSYWTAGIEHERGTSGPELCDGNMLTARIARAITDGTKVVSWEEPHRFPLAEPDRAAILREYPNASGIFRTWQQASEEQRAAWAQTAPEPCYLMPPMITPSRHRWSISKAQASPQR